MSLAFHLRHPEQVRALMLFDTGPGFRNDSARGAWNARARARADDLESRGFAALGSSDEVRMSQHRSAAGLAGAARGMLTQQDDGVIRSLETIRVPTLVLVGANDTNFLAATDYMAAKIPGRHEAGDSRRRPCIQFAPAGSIQSGGGGVPGGAAIIRSSHSGQKLLLMPSSKLNGHVSGKFCTRSPVSRSALILARPESIRHRLCQMRL